MKIVLLLYFSDNEHPEILLIFHTAAYFSYDSGGMSLGDSEINYYFFW